MMLVSSIVLLMLAGALVVNTLRAHAFHYEQYRLARELGVDFRSLQVPSLFPATYVMNSIQPGLTTCDEVHALALRARVRARYVCAGNGEKFLFRSSELQDADVFNVEYDEVDRVKKR